MDFENLNVWITGGSSGIGFALANQFAERGSTVVISSRSKERLTDAFSKIKKNSKVFVYPCDVSNQSDIKKVYQSLVENGINVNLLVNNAGNFYPGKFLNYPLDKFEDSFATNVRGVFLCTQIVLPSMVENNFGIIINILSVVVNKTFVNSSIYSATKSAVLAMSRSLREEVRDKNIKIMNVYPGATSTSIWSAPILEKYSERMMKPEELARAIICNVESSLKNGIMVEDLVVRPQLGDL
ncbi:MAG: SDR family NAD(P)-dependent oxidoreductase [Ignavibacteria bacterium]|nr:SDR family NAD(P)-dependent oxidoreductase [Ignavibacteria bacterium]